MSKSLITRVFVGSLIAFVGGILVFVAGLVVAFSNGVFIMDGPDVVGVNQSALGWSAIGLAAVGTITMIGGAIGQFVAWIGAVINTARLEDKTWFILLLVLGLFSFGFIAMLVYVLAGPDGYEPARPASTSAQALGHS